MPRGVVAITGATGFLGRHLAVVLAAEGWRVRVLARRDVIDPAWRALEPQVVVGDLADAAALAALCDGAELVIHAAGLIKAKSRQAFDRANVEGARRVAQAARAAGSRFVQVSSLTARVPALSDYAASKRAGEEAVRAEIGDALLVVRPPAIYGPGDIETLRLFKAAAGPVLPVLDPAARVAVVHVEDAARQIAALAAARATGVFALSDARIDGYGWVELMTAAAQAVGARPRLVRIPGATLSLAAATAGLAARLSGQVSILGPGKARELRHLDWSLRVGEIAPETPPPRFTLAAGFAQSVRWYRTRGWLNEKKNARIGK
ncbi:MAG: NAD-dependent epimerase/dehydratase [Caulobacter sp.]|nr:NAD-dependent epimerase/dehydratase [Caulobacter sp.]